MVGSLRRVLATCISNPKHLLAHRDISNPKPKSLAAHRDIRNPNRLLRAHLHMSTRSRSEKRTITKHEAGGYDRTVFKFEPRNATVITGRLMQEHWPCPPPAERREDCLPMSLESL